MTAQHVRGALPAGLFAALLFVNASDARACTCAPPPPPGEELAAAAAVFEGRVTRISSTPIPGSYPQLIEVELDVTRVWKGDLARRTVVRTATSDASCGIAFTIGTSYLVYAHANQQALLANLCSRTTASANGADDFASLGPAQPPAADGNPTPGCAVSGDGPSGGTNLLLAGIGLLALRRLRTRR